jgi:hypothetical protein
MADDKDKYVSGRGNPSLDPTRTDLGPQWYKGPEKYTLGGPAWDKGPEKYTLGSKDSFATDPNLLKLSSDKGDALLRQTSFSRDSSGLLTSKDRLDQTNKDIAARQSSAFTRNKNGLMSLKEGEQVAIPKTERANPQRDISGGGAKSGIRPSKKLSSFGRSVPYDSFSPSAVNSQFFRQAVKSFKHFVPQFGLYGSGFHGGPIRIQPMRWEGAFPVMDIQQWNSAGSATTYTQDEEDE